MSSTTSPSSDSKSQFKPFFGININPNVDESDLAFELAKK
jgi:hypothetical protein